MKTNSTLACTVLSAVISLLLSFNTAKAQCVAPAMTYANSVLVSGTAGEVNALYKFPSVTPGVDAFITILSKVGGATLTSIDNNTYGYNAAWQPVVKTPATQGAGESYIGFKIEYKNSNNGSNHTYSCFVLSFIDVDGDNQHVREFVATKNFDSYTVANNTTLTMTQPSGFTQATGTVANYNNIDTSSYRTNINFNFTNKDKINEVRVGNKTDASFTVQDRYACGYFSNITMPLTLPVDYLSFDAVVNDKSVLLKWITALEINNSHFEVERSFDMNSYSTAGLVLDGFTTNGSGKSYQFKDNSTQLQGRSIVYYRLKQIDIDGKATYSKVIAVRLQAKADVSMQVSPNPFVENVTVRFTATENGNAQIRITNLAGQTMLSKQSTISKGYNNIKIDGLGGLATGMYLAQLVLNGTVIDNQKLIKN
ncbi:MAG: T9SS type A sorting domain-containing protein [Ferruginibacter sp.]